MLLSQLIGERTKSAPSDSTAASHGLLVRAGFIKAVANGIWTLAYPARRITRKIEGIIREEMDRLGGQEVLFPVVMPRELWEESGRYDAIGEELARFKDRFGRGLVLGMTHEEAAVQFARDTVSSYQRLPFLIYQIQTKFRDEARCRGGLIRVREFTMKDGYSFHLTQESLDELYEKVFDAYFRIFRRIGLKNVIAVKSDSGMMGGNAAHEFMLLTDIGEDSIAMCDACGYKANLDVATCERETARDAISEPAIETDTGAAKEIDEVCAALGVGAEKTVKAVCYRLKGENRTVVCFVRGDLEISESKLARHLGKGVAPANLDESSGLVAGNIGCLGLDARVAAPVFDRSLEHANNMVTGANKAGLHIVGADFDRDVSGVEYVDVAKVRSGERCPVCGKPLTVRRGIEIGNIFRLGTKYTEAMGMTVLDSRCRAVFPLMGCYGIGIGRALASAAEESHDERGLMWPMSIAPWHAHLCALRADLPEVREKAAELHDALIDSGVEAMLDDRDASAGVKFSDCDLMGAPIRVVISPKTLAAGKAEIKTRDGALSEQTDLSDAPRRIREIVRERIEP